MFSLCLSVHGERVPESLSGGYPSTDQGHPRTGVPLAGTGILRAVCRVRFPVGGLSCLNVSLPREPG